MTAGFSVLKLGQSQANLDSLTILGYCVIDIKYMSFLKIKVRVEFLKNKEYFLNSYCFDLFLATIL